MAYILDESLRIAYQNLILLQQEKEREKKENPLDLVINDLIDKTKTNKIIWKISRNSKLKTDQRVRDFYTATTEKGQICIAIDPTDTTITVNLFPFIVEEVANDNVTFLRSTIEKQLEFLNDKEKKKKIAEAARLIATVIDCKLPESFWDRAEVSVEAMSKLGLTIEQIKNIDWSTDNFGPAITCSILKKPETKKDEK